MVARVLQFLFGLLAITIVMAKTYTIDSSYCQQTIGSNTYHTVTLKHQQSATLIYGGESTGVTECSYNFNGEKPLAKNYKLCVSTNGFNNTACNIAMTYYAFYTQTSTAAKSYNCSTTPQQFCTNKTNLLIGFRAQNPSATEIELTIIATDLGASGVSTLKSTVMPLVFTGLMLLLKIIL